MKALVVAALLTVTAAHADTWGPSGGHTILNVRAYSDGSLVFQFSPALNAGCQYNDHSITSPTSPAYKLVSALVTTAFSTGRKVQIIYNGCNTNVNVTGVSVL